MCNMATANETLHRPESAAMPAFTQVCCIQCKALHTMQSRGMKAKKRIGKQAGKGDWKARDETKGSRGNRGVCSKRQVAACTDLCDTAPRLKDLLFLRVRGRGELAGSPRSPLLLPLDTPLLLWCRLVLGSIAAAFVRIHALHSIVLCTHHHTHPSEPHAEAFTCCWSCL